jgi:WD40 repeat protein
MAHEAPQEVPDAGFRTQAELGFLAPPKAPGEMGWLGPYRVLKVLGHGGMGVVLQAEDVKLQRVVALKVMLPALAQRPEAKERFLREARAAAAIEHDHIVAIYQVDEAQGVPFIAMPFLKGMSLEDFLRQKAARGTRLKLLEVCKIGREIAKGLSAAHERGLIHRDIKPANIWLDQSAGGRVKILDFGLARLTQQANDKNLTQDGAIIGTPAYMAPEQAQGGKVDARTDLFSLGVVLYRMSTSELPFRGPDMISTLMAVATTEPPSPKTLRPDLPQELSDLVIRLLAKEPSKRPASAQIVVKAITEIEKAYQGPQPPPRPAVSAGPHDTVAVEWPSSPRGKQRQPSRHHRSMLAWLFGAGAIVGAVTAIFLLWSPSSPTNQPTSAPGSTGQETAPALAALSPLALVSRPPKLLGVQSWTIEPHGHRGATAHGTVVAYSADGKQFATGSTDGTVRLWEPANGQLVRILLGHGQGITALAWSPDGKALASGSADNTVRLWAPDTGKLLLTFTRHTGAVTALTWSPDGKAIASGGADKSVLLWDSVSGEERRRFDRHQTGIVEVSWHSDDTLVSTDSNNALWIWEASTGKALHSHKGKRPYHWSVDRKMMVYTSGVKEVTFWEPQGNRARSLALKEHSGAIGSCALSPDGKLLITGGDGLLHCWAPDSGKLLATHSTLPGWPHKTTALYFSPDGKVLIARRLHGMLLLYQTAALQKEGAKSVAFGGPHGWVRWSPDSKAFVASRDFGGRGPFSLQFFNAVGRGLASLADSTHAGGDVAWSPDGKLLAIGNLLAKARTQDASSGKVLHIADEEPRGPQSDRRNHLGWSPDGKVLAIYTGNYPEKQVRLFDAQTGARLKNGLIGPPMRVVTWSPDSTKIATADDVAVYLYDAATGKEMSKRPLPRTPDNALAWSPDSQVLATGGKSIKLWSADTGAAIPTLFSEPGTTVQAVAWSPDGKLIAGGDSAGAIRLHNAQTGAVMQTYQGHDGPIHALAWMPDSTTVLSLGEGDNTVCSWKVGAERPFGVSKGFPGRARFSPDRKLLASHHDHSGTQIWDIEPTRLRGTLMTIHGAQEHYLAVSADGHYRFTGDAQRYLAYVVQTESGQDTFTPQEFEKKYGWHNDPDKVRLTSPE